MKPTIHIHINTPTVKTRDVGWSARHTGNFNFEVTTPKGGKILIGRAQNSTEAIEKAKKLPEGSTHDAIGETFPTLAAAKGEVGKLAAKNIRAKVNQEVDETTKKMYFVVVRL
jgi:hypothetical protein